MLFGIPFGGFALFWIAGASGFKIPDFSEGGFSFFPLFGLPFFLIGLGMVLSPVWEAIKARSTVYVITTMRAIIFEPSIFGGMDITSFRADDLADISRTQRTDGSGDLVFAREVSHGRNGTRVKEIGFLGIPRVKAVEDMLRALRGESVR